MSNVDWASGYAYSTTHFTVLQMTELQWTHQDGMYPNQRPPGNMPQYWRARTSPPHLPPQCCIMNILSVLTAEPRGASSIRRFITLLYKSSVHFKYKWCKALIDETAAVFDEFITTETTQIPNASVLGCHGAVYYRALYIQGTFPVRFPPTIHTVRFLNNTVGFPEISLLHEKT